MTLQMLDNLVQEDVQYKTLFQQFTIFALMQTRFRGYRASFIDKTKTVKLPILSDELLAAIAPVKNSREDILRYKNYSIVQHAERRFPIFTASNIDGRKLRKITRRSLFGGAKDKWRKDKRISYKHQWGDKLYRATKSDFDKGHLTKREDVQWGSTLQDAIQGGLGTFYFTNCIPQRKEINRGIWLKIEEYILQNNVAKNALKINVFTGPVLTDEDPIFITPIENEDVKLPTLFWKVIYYLTTANELARVAFLVGQKHILEQEGIVFKTRSIAKEDELFMNFEEAETYQVEIKLIEELTGLTFAPAFDIFKDDRPSVLILEEIQVRGLEGKGIKKNLSGLVL